MIEFTIPGKAIPKERARILRNPIITKRGKKIYAFTPTQTKNYQNLVRTLALVARNKYEIFTPYRDEVAVVMLIYSQKKTRIDIDNIAKIILDALNKIIYYDDRQVAALMCYRMYCDQGFEGVTVGIHKI